MKLLFAAAASAIMFAGIGVLVLADDATTPSAENAKSASNGKTKNSKSKSASAKSTGAKGSDADDVQAEHATIGVETSKGNFPHTTNPEAQWYPKAGFGLFIHWGLASVRASNISWPMIPGRRAGSKSNYRLCRARTDHSRRRLEPERQAQQRDPRRILVRGA